MSNHLNKQCSFLNERDEIIKDYSFFGKGITTLFCENAGKENVWGG